MGERYQAVAGLSMGSSLDCFSTQRRKGAESRQDYLPASTNHASLPLESPTIAALENYGSTKVLLRLTPMTNAATYQVQVSPDGGKTWVESCISRQARRIVLMNLTPGTTYLVRARAIGGSTGASDWSGTGSIMST